MRVAIVSTYPPRRCGVGTYTRGLATALWRTGDVDLRVIAEQGAAPDESGLRVCPVFRREDPDWPAAILADVRRMKPDLVHVQYAMDIFGLDARMPALCRALVAQNVRVVVTLHSVLPSRAGWAIGRYRVGRFYRMLAATAQLVVHHWAGQGDALVAHGVPAAAISVIPHGTEQRAPVDPGAARRRYAVPAGAPLLAMVGFIQPLKNVHAVIGAVERLRATHPALRLVIAGCVRDESPLARAYLAWLRWRVARSAPNGPVTLADAYLPDRDLDEVLAATDVLLLPYWQPYGSASGVAHRGLAMGTPMLCSPAVKFTELRAVAGDDAIVPGYGAAAWARRIDEVVRDVRWAPAMRQRLAAHAQATRWPVVAEQTVRLYGLLATRLRASEAGRP